MINILQKDLDSCRNLLEYKSGRVNYNFTGLQKL